MPNIVRPVPSRTRPTPPAKPAAPPAPTAGEARRRLRALVASLLLPTLAGCGAFSGEGEKLDLTNNPPAPRVPVPDKVRGRPTSQPLDTSPTP